MNVHMPKFYQGQLIGNTSQIVDHENGSAIFTNLSLSSRGSALLEVTFASQPAFYNITQITTVIKVQQSDYVEPNKTIERNLRIIFKVDYTTVIGDRADVFTATCASQINSLFSWPQNFTLYDFSVSEGKPGSSIQSIKRKINSSILHMLQDFCSSFQAA